MREVDKQNKLPVFILNGKILPLKGKTVSCKHTDVNLITNNMKRRTFLLSATSGCLALLLPNQASAIEGFREKENAEYSFIHLSDPQFGMFGSFEKHHSFEKETKLMQQAVDAINRLKPQYVLVTGDLVHDRNNLAQVAEYKRLTALIDKKIPVYEVPGNHDVGNDATVEDVEQYKKRFGADRFAFSYKNTYVIGINSNLIWAGNTPLEREQAQWLQKELKKGQKYKYRIVAGHHPIYVNQPDEKKTYENLPPEKRTEYLELFRNNKVDIYLSGHLHFPASNRSAGVPLCTAGAVGYPIRGKSGMNIVSVTDAGVKATFFDFGQLPQSIDKGIIL